MRLLHEYTEIREYDLLRLYHGLGCGNTETLRIFLGDRLHIQFMVKICTTFGRWRVIRVKLERQQPYNKPVTITYLPSRAR